MDMTFAGIEGQTITVMDGFSNFVGFDVETEEGERIPVNVDFDTAVGLALTLLGAAGAYITEVDSAPAEVDEFDVDELALIEVLNRLAAAHEEATDPLLREILITLGLGFVMDGSPATKAAVRALVGA